MNRSAIATAFPSSPSLRGKWRPIYLEPIFSSGERLTIAIAVTAQHQAIVKSVIRPEVMKWLYGSRAPNMRGLVELCIESFMEHIKSGGDVENWSPPTTGVTFGAERDAAAETVEGILEQAIQWSASLSSIEQSTLDVPSDDEEQRASAHLTEQILRIVTAKRIELAPSFNKFVKFYENGDTVRFGFLGNGIAAQFGTLKHRTLSMNVKDARGRLWELNKARKHIPLKQAGLILYVHPSDSASLTDRQAATLEGAANELRLEAVESDLEIRRIGDVVAGANALLAMAA